MKKLIIKKFNFLWIFPISIIIYLFTQRSKDYGFFDASEYALHIQGGGIAHAPGYPLYILIGKFFFFFTKDPFLAQILISIFSLIILCFTFYKTFEDKLKNGALVALTLFLSSYYLKLFTVLPEVFILNLALFSSLGFFLKQWFKYHSPTHLFFIFFIYGLGACHHHTLILCIPATLYIFFQKRKKINLTTSFFSSILGFIVGALPFIYFFVPLHSKPSDVVKVQDTYFFIQNLNDFFFVLLRKGYGTFRLSTETNIANHFNIYLTLIKGFFINYNYLFCFLFLPFFLKFKSLKEFKNYLKKTPEFSFALITVFSFILFFFPNANIPLGNFHDENILFRFGIIFYFLLIYFIPESYKIIEPKIAIYLKKIKFLINPIIFILFIITISNIAHLNLVNFSHHTLIKQHISKSYESIFLKNDIKPNDISPQHYSCAIYSSHDALLFSAQYHTRFVAEKKCFIFSTSSFSNQFRSYYEEILQFKTLEKEYSQILNDPVMTSNKIVSYFFKKLMDQGFQVFLLYQTDSIFFENDFGIKLHGNLIQLTLEKNNFSVSDHIEQFSYYLKILELYLTQLSLSPLPKQVIDNAISTAFFQNLLSYPTTPFKIHKTPLEMTQEEFSQLDVLFKKSEELRKLIQTIYPAFENSLSRNKTNNS